MAAEPLRVNVAEARRRLSELLGRVLAGETVEIARRDTVVAVLAPPKVVTGGTFAEELAGWRMEWDVDSAPDDEPFPVLPYSGAAAAWHARERARLEAEGFPRPFADGQVAAIAATEDLVLVTRNVEDFAGYRRLRVESWWPST